MEFDEVIVVDVGDHVYCDYCNEDYTTRPDSGGLLFNSKAACPKCAPRIEDSANQYGEQRYIRARCPEGKPFAKWVMEDLR